MNIQYLGHSCVLIETGSHRVIVDPFVSGNPLCPVGVDDLQPDFVVLTHAHGDHWGDTLEFARRGAFVISTFEIVTYAQRQDGAVQGRPMNNGGSAQFEFGRVTFTNAWHSSSFPDGTYGGSPMGVILEIEGKRVHHAGDTALFSDLKLVGDRGLDLSFVPIGDNFTMGPDDALEAVRLLRPKAVVPVHYNTFDLIRQDGDAFADRASALGFAGHALAPGATLTL